MLWICLFCAACTPRLRPPEVGVEDREAAYDDVAVEALDLFLARQAHLLRVAHRLRTRGADLCGDEVAPVPSIAVWKAWKDLSRAFFWAFEQRFGSTQSMTVTAIVPGSAAERAGVTQGDEVLAVDHSKVRSVIDFYRGVRKARGSLELTIGRGSARHTFELKPDISCRYGVLLKPSDYLEAGQAAGDNIYVSTGLVRFAETDDELAAAVAHAIGRRILPGSVATTREGAARADPLATGP